MKRVRKKIVACGELRKCEWTDETALIIAKRIMVKYGSRKILSLEELPEGTKVYPYDRPTFIAYSMEVSKKRWDLPKEDRLQLIADMVFNEHVMNRL
jgi:hypothetical protein